MTIYLRCSNVSPGRRVTPTWKDQIRDTRTIKIISTGESESSIESNLLFDISAGCIDPGPDKINHYTETV